MSSFSFLRGASQPRELVARARELGYVALALTDECSLAGVARAHLAAREHGFKLIIGSEFALAGGPRLVFLATDRASYGDLSELITHARRAGAKGSYRLTRADLARYARRGLVLLLPDDDPDAEQASWIARLFPGRAWIAVELMLDGCDGERLGGLRRLGAQTGLPLVAAGGARMHSRDRRRLHDVLTAIRLGTTVQAAGHALHPNGERHLRRLDELAGIYPADLLDETVRIARRCTFSLEELRYEYPEELVPAGQTPAGHLRQLAQAGMGQRWPQGAPPKVRALVERELALIRELGYEPYFLTVYDIVRFARARGILCQGRGSAANSAVCYCLGITEVDPGRIEMLFERFISKERDEPPDIDVDFEHERREEVIQYVYGKYGRDRAALAATVITYRARSAVRDVGKALGLTLEQVDRLAKNLQWWDGGAIDPVRLRETGFAPDSPVIRQLIEFVDVLLDFPRHLSQHVGGFVIARDSLARLVPIENAAMPERTVIQWDKDDLESLGLLKVDCLGLGMLTVLHKAFDLIERRDGRRFAPATVPAEDPRVYEMIQHADTVGVFQIESRAQMSMLPRLKPKCFYDLVIEIAIVRPGPIQGNMVHPYLRRRQGLEPVRYPSEQVRAVLSRTLGVPIFQEQVIKLAMVAAGFSAGEADGLRRAMAAWHRRGGLEPYERRLIDGMRSRGYSETFARQIFEQIKGFGEYGFPESHSASFALLAYVSAWLKCHEPAVFLCALLNSQPMGFYAPAQLVQDACRHGVEARPVDVRFSEWDCTLEPSPHPSPCKGEGGSVEGSYDWSSPHSSSMKWERGSWKEVCNSGPSPHPSPISWERGSRKEACSNWPSAQVLSRREEGSLVAGQNKSTGNMTVRLGFRLVQKLSRAGAERLIQARGRAPFADVADLAHRARLNRRDIEALAAAGALAGIAGHRYRARWAAAGLEPPLPLLRQAGTPEALPLLRPPTEGEDIVLDYASLGLTLGRHPLALIRKCLLRLKLLSAAEIRALPHGAQVRAGGLVVCRQHPSSSKGVIFVTLEDETGHTNVIVWSGLAQRQRRELLQARLMGVTGEVQREGEVLHVIARHLEDHSPLLGRLETHSRDFH